MEQQKRLVAINDISGFGKCSLTVALPIISAAGIETVCMPTAVLSTHTGGFTGFTYRDLTEDLPAIAKHWKSINLRFDAIYSGFLGSFDQIDIVKQFVTDFKNDDTLFIADPCMADLGKMYTVFDAAFAEKMTTLCALADIVLPNITEACFMTNTPYCDGVQTKEYIESLLHALLDLGAKSAVLTGVSFEEDKLGAAVITQNGEISYRFSERLEGNFHGTGDVFASAFSGALLNGFTLPDAAGIAVDYTCDCISRTKEVGDAIRYGVDFERGIPFYLKKLGKV